MFHSRRETGEVRQFNDGAVEVTEFNFDDKSIMNDAIISLSSRYPESGYVANSESTAIVSVEQGEAYFHIKDVGPSHVNEGDRILIEPNEPYYVEPLGKFVMRYIATPAWTPEQAYSVR